MGGIRLGKIYVRIDDRLIHGQIIAAWGSHLNIGRIIGIDDKTAKNPMLKQIMTMSVPKKYQSDVLSKEEAKGIFTEPFEGNTLVILRFPEDLGNYFEELKGVEQIIVGNVAKKENSIYEMNAGTSIFYLTEKDFNTLSNLHEKGQEIVFRTVPGSSEISWESFLKNKKQKK